MSQRKYVQKLLFLSKRNDFKILLDKLRKEYDLPQPFGEEFSKTIEWNKSLYRKRQDAGLPPPNIIFAVRAFFSLYTNIFPPTFYSTFFNYVYYGMPAIKEEQIKEGETPKVHIEIDFRGKEQKLYLRIFGDTIWNDIARCTEYLDIIQKGEDIFKSHLSGKKYKRKRKDPIFEKMVIFKKGNDSTPDELRIKVDGSTTSADLEKAFTIAQTYQKYLPEHKNFQVLDKRKFSRKLKFLDMQSKGIHFLDQIDILWKSDNSFASNEEHKKQFKQKLQKHRRQLRNMRYSSPLKKMI